MMGALGFSSCLSAPVLSLGDACDGDVSPPRVRRAAETGTGAVQESGSRLASAMGMGRSSCLFIGAMAEEDNSTLGGCV